MTSRRIAVIGGGISGLTVSFELLDRAERQEPSIDVVCLEASERAGGNIRSTRERGFLYEWAANGFLDNAPATVTLARRLGLDDRVLRAREAATRRFVFRKGRLREVPTTPRAMLGSGVIPWWAKLRLAAEPLIPARRSDDEESIFRFASRRIGRHAASVLVDAMVSGIYAGNVHKLSLPATFPEMRRMEEEHGSLVRAMIARGRRARAEGRPMGGPAGPGGTLTSFVDGMQELPDALARTLGPRLRLRAPVARISGMGRRGFRIHPREGAPLDVDGVVVTCPAWAASSIVEPLDPELAMAVGGVPSASLATVHVGYRRDAIVAIPEGFGFLVPRGQGPQILGALWSSNIFEQRAPDGSVLLTAMVGGAHDPAAVDRDDAELVDIVRTDLRTAMGILADPYFVRIVRHPRGIPQYELGHMARLATLEQRQAAHPGLWLAGNSYHGISINACVAEAAGVAESVLEFLARRSAA